MTKAPKPKTHLQDFLSMFDQVKQDPTKHLEEHKDDDEIIISDYLSYDKDHHLKTEAYYVTKMAQIKGMLSMDQHAINFHPVKCAENEAVRR